MICTARAHTALEREACANMLSRCDREAFCNLKDNIYSALLTPSSGIGIYNVRITDTESMETQYIHACMPLFGYALELILC